MNLDVLLTLRRSVAVAKKQYTGGKGLAYVDAEIAVERAIKQLLAVGDKPRYEHGQRELDAFLRRLSQEPPDPPRDPSPYRGMPLDDPRRETLRDTLRDAGKRIGEVVRWNADRDVDGGAALELALSYALSEVEDGSPAAESLLRALRRSGSTS